MSAGFGISSPGTNQQSRNTTENIEYDEMLNEKGEVVEMTTVKKTADMTEDFIVPKGGTVTDPVIPGQCGTRVVTSFAVAEENSKYVRYTISTRHGGEAISVGIDGGTVAIVAGTTNNPA